MCWVGKISMFVNSTGCVCRSAYYGAVMTAFAAQLPGVPTMLVLFPFLRNHGRYCEASDLHALWVKPDSFNI